MHPTWKRHSTPLHSPLRCHRFFSSPLSYLFSLSLTLPSPSCLHLMSPVSCTALSLSLLGFLVSFFENVLFSFTLPLSSPPPFVPYLFLYFCSLSSPTSVVVFVQLTPFCSFLFSFSCSVVCPPFSLLGLPHTHLVWLLLGLETLDFPKKLFSLTSSAVCELFMWLFLFRQLQINSRRNQNSSSSFDLSGGTFYTCPV